MTNINRKEHLIIISITNLICFDDEYLTRFYNDNDKDYIFGYYLTKYYKVKRLILTNPKENIRQINEYIKANNIKVLNLIIIAHGCYRGNDFDMYLTNNSRKIKYKVKTFFNQLGTLKIQTRLLLSVCHANLILNNITNLPNNSYIVALSMDTTIMLKTLIIDKLNLFFKLYTKLSLLKLAYIHYLNIKTRNFVYLPLVSYKDKNGKISYLRNDFCYTKRVKLHKNSDFFLLNKPKINSNLFNKNKRFIKSNTPFSYSNLLDYITLPQSRVI